MARSQHFVIFLTSQCIWSPPTSHLQPLLYWHIHLIPLRQQKGALHLTMAKPTTSSKLKKPPLTMILLKTTPTDDYTTSNVPEAVTGTVFIRINWTLLESRLLDFYRAYVPSCKAQWPSPVSSRCIKMDSDWNAGCNGEFFVLAWCIKLSPRTLTPACHNAAMTVPSKGFVRLVKHSEILRWSPSQKCNLTEKGRAAQPAPKGRYFVLRLFLTAWGDILELPFYNRGLKTTEDWVDCTQQLSVLFY